jgi:hypothetical protein
MLKSIRLSFSASTNQTKHHKRTRLWLDWTPICAFKIRLIAVIAYDGAVKRQRIRVSHRKSIRR